MPKSFFDIPDVHPSIQRPVTFAAASFLAKTLRLPKDVDIVIPEDTGVAQVEKIFRDQCNTDVTFENENRMRINFTEEPGNEPLTTPAQCEDNYPLWIDSERDIKIFPVRHAVRVVCEIELTGQSRTPLQRLTDYIRTRISAMQGAYAFDVDYSYPIPDSILMVLQEAYRCISESETGTDLTFPQYIQKYRQQPMLTLETIIGTAPRIAFGERQEEILGWFDFVEAPSALQPTQSQTGTYQVSFSFIFQYARPTQFFVTWPLLINNVTVGKDFRLKHAHRTFYDVPRKVSKLKAPFDAMRFADADALPPYLRLPEVDDWINKNPPTNAIRLFSALIPVKEETDIRMFDFSQIGEWSLSPYILEYIQHKGKEAFGNGSLFQLHLYENEDEIPFKFEIEGTTVICKSKLNLERYYHVEFSVSRNWHYVRKSDMNCLRRYPHLFLLLGRFLRLPFGFTDVSSLDRVGVNAVRITDDLCPGEGAFKTDEQGNTVISDTPSNGTIKTPVIEEAIKETLKRETNTSSPENNQVMRTVLFSEIIVLRRDNQNGNS